MKEQVSWGKGRSNNPEGVVILQTESVIN